MPPANEGHKSKDKVCPKGLILFPDKVGSVKETVTNSSTKLLNDPEAQYFYTKNPQFDQGDELACLAKR